MEEQNIKVAVDAIVFGYNHNQLHVLLVRQKYGPMQGRWVLVGGFLQNGESLQSAMERELQEETGLSIKYLEQLYTFGDDVHRDPRAQVISVAYFALVNNTDLIPRADTDAEEALWFPMNQLPQLGYDHDQILQMALKRLQAKLTYQPIGFDLLPELFLFSDLENLYCSILGREIDRRNFRKKVLSFGFVEETELIAQKGAGRPAKYFRFNKLKYNQLEKEGMAFEIQFA
ncbi:MAG TPA: NUDIX domain-containing protein [Saprospiraceae bacterium]|nr:NUDIX domain-containing protein [Saprospiraceae bacterium]